MKLHKYCALIIFLASLAPVKMDAQQLYVGDKIPSFQLKNILNYNKTQLTLNDFKNKYLILEFWSKTCVVCIKSFPKLLNLQKTHMDKLQIIAINSDSQEETNKIITKQKIETGIIPFVTEDRLLKMAFPKNYVPWIIWVDDKGIIKYISDSEWLTSENINLFIKGSAPILVQNSYIEKAKYATPIFAQSNEKWKDKVVYYSYISNCVKGNSIRNLTLKEGPQTYRLTRNCKSIMELFQTAFAEGNHERFEHANKVILNVRNLNSFIRPKEKDTAWELHNSYNYEISVPASHSESIYKMMQDDLKRIFNVSVSIQKEKIESLVLIRTDSIDRLNYTKKVDSAYIYNQDTCRNISLKNRPFKEFVFLLQSLFNPSNSDAPLIDATGYSANIDIILDRILFEGLDLPSLRLALYQLGLDIVNRKVETEVLIIKEN